MPHLSNFKSTMEIDPLLIITDGKQTEIFNISQKLKLLKIIKNISFDSDSDRDNDSDSDSDSYCDSDKYKNRYKDRYNNSEDDLKIIEDAIYASNTFDIHIFVSSKTLNIIKKYI